MGHTEPRTTLNAWPACPASTSPERGGACRNPLTVDFNDEDFAASRLFLRQQRAYGRDDFREMVEAKTQRIAGCGRRIGRAAVEGSGSEPDPVVGAVSATGQQRCHVSL